MLTISREVSDLALALRSLLVGCETVTRGIDRLRRQVASAPLVMVSIAEQCSTICSAIARLQSLNLQDAAAFKAQRRRLIHILESIMIGSKGTLSLIEECMMDPCASEEQSLDGDSEQSQLTATRVSFSEAEEMRELLSQLNGYQNSLSELLDASKRYISMSLVTLSYFVANMLVIASLSTRCVDTSLTKRLHLMTC